GSLRFTIAENDIAQFLQGPENEERIEVHSNQCTKIYFIVKEEIHQGEHNTLLQEVHKCPLDEANRTDAFYLLQFKLQYPVCISVEPSDLLLRKSEAFYKLYVAERLCGGACQSICFFYNGLLDRLDPLAEYAGEKS